MKTKRARNQNAESRTCSQTSLAQLSKHHRRRNFSSHLVLFSVVLLCLTGSACVRTESACPEEYAAAHPEECQNTTRHQITDPRFEFPTPSEERSQDFWLRAGDQLVVRWSEYTILWNRAGVTCDFNTTPPPTNSDCAVCTHCNPRPCSHSTVFAGTEPQLLGFELFRLESESSRQTLGVTSGCAASGFPFTPEKNTTFQLLKYSDNLTPLAETKAFVVRSGESQQILYELSLLPQGVADVTFFKGTVPGDQIIEDNFGTNLHITGVRILKGWRGRDPATGKLQLLNASLVHPSRIVIIPKYDGGEVYQNGQDTNRCYTDESASGDLDLTRCRAVREGRCTGNPVTDPASCRQLATPTYLAGSADLVTWVAEFKPSEGGIYPGLEVDEILAIEFTIEAN
jgi:hypothetical protein